MDGCRAGELVDAQGVAEMLGLAHRNSVSVYQKRYGDMPRPVVDHGSGRPKLWSLPEMEEWSVRAGRDVRQRGWQRDAHYRDILDGLDGDLDRVLFEDCIADILNPGLLVVPVRGGADLGMDGAVFDGEGHAYPLVTTTAKNVIGNLTDSLRSYLANGGRRRRVVLATSVDLTARRRRNLEQRACDLGFELVQVFDRRGVADLLYRDPRWCRQLLGLTGDPLPFLPFPPTPRLLRHCRLVGRETQVGLLRSGRGDQLLVGPPGSGKTAILSDFAQHTGALFLHSKDATLIHNGVRSQTPTMVIVDDAFEYQEQLGVLLRLRREGSVRYRMVASCWPDEKDTLARSFDIGPSAVVQLPLLTRDQMVEVVKEAGIEGPNELVREIVDQAMGLPGLAVTIAGACLRGDIRDLGSGQVVSREIRAMLKLGGLSSATQILAVLGFGGEMGMRLADAGTGLGLPIAEVLSEMKKLEPAGVLHPVGSGRFAVYPEALRHALVRDVFFEGEIALPVEPFMHMVKPFQLSTLATDAKTGTPVQWLSEEFATGEVARVLVGVEQAGGKVPPTILVDSLRKANSDRAWADWGALGVVEARQALRERPTAVLAHPYPFLYWTPDQALWVLLDIASRQRQPQNSRDRLLEAIAGTDRPLMNITKWIKEEWDPTEVQRRRQLAAKTAIRWGGEHPSSDLPLQVLAVVLHPEYETTSLDPGVGDTLTITSGILGLPALREIALLWEEPIRPFLRGQPANRLHPIVRAVTSWTNLSDQPLPEFAETLESLAQPMITDLKEWTLHHPALRLEITQSAERPEAEPHSPDWVYELMYGPLQVTDPERPDTDNLRRPEEERASRVRELGQIDSASEPAIVVAKLADLEGAWSDTGSTWPRFAPVYAETLATHNHTDPLVWVELLTGAYLGADLVAPFLSRAVDNRSEKVWKTIPALMKRPQYEWLAIRLVLTASDAPPDVMKEVISRIEPHTRQLGWLVEEEQISPQAMERLLRHDKDDVAVPVAIGLWRQEHTPPSDPTLALLWKRGIMRARERSPNSGYRLERVLRSDPELAFEWVVTQLQESPPTYLGRESPTKIVIDSLDEPSRIRLLPHLQPTHRSHRVVARIVGNNPAVFKALLYNRALKTLHLAPLEGRIEKDGMSLDKHWVSRVELALKSGYSPEQITTATFPRSYARTGKESEMWIAWIAAFNSIPAGNSDLETIRDKGIDTAQQQLHHARKREHNRQIYGHHRNW